MSREKKKVIGKDLRCEENVDTIVKNELTDNDKIDKLHDKSKEIIGFVTNCIKLNIRKEPNINSDVICIKTISSKLKVVDKCPDSGWYRVSDNNGIDGYCMKEYLALDVFTG